MYKKWPNLNLLTEEQKKFNKKHSSTKIREHFEVDISLFLIYKISCSNFKDRAVQKS